MKISFLSFVVILFLTFISSGFRTPVHSIYQFDYENVLGTSFQLKVETNSEEIANYAEQTALHEIDRLASILSTYDPWSEINLWQKTHNTEVRLSAELFEVLQLFDAWNKKTSGALTASIATASDLWKKSEANQHVPSTKELDGAVQAMKQPQWRLNNKEVTAVHLSDQSLVLNSFVKSYIIRKISDKVMGIPGVVSAVTNIGGDIVIAGSHTEKVSIANPIAHAENDHPVSILSLHERAIATSGDYRRGFQIGNEWFSHIIDPRTAIPVSAIISATVVAENATDAGALATAFNILLPEESEALAGTLHGIDYQIITKDGKQITSKGWNLLQVSNENHLNSNNQEQAKLTIEFELARFEGRFHRPFVAVWIENKKKASVRNVALWYNKPRWLPDLKRWYSKNQSVTEDMAARESISSATRSAGKYSLTWDGLDNEGKVVPSGTYIVYIEAAREHGTYQLIREEIDWKGKSKHYDLKGGIEITSGSLDITE